MPTSYMQNIPKVVEIMQRLKPKKVLDIGIGNGKYGLLAKEYIEGVVVDGVEAWEPYITNIQKSIYRKIYMEDISCVKLQDLPEYDLYLMIDVIEHVPKPVGHRILQDLNGLILVSTPVEDYRAHYDNHFEDHVSHWTLDDFKNYPYEDFTNEFSTMVLVDTSEAARENTIAQLRKENSHLKNELEAMKNSTSWKGTSPLRAAKRKLSRK